MNPLVNVIREFWKKLKPRFVFIDQEMLNAFASELAVKRMETPTYHKPGILPENDEAYATFILYFNAINFGSVETQAPNQHKKYQRWANINGERILLSGSTAIAHCLYQYFKEDPIDPRHIINIMQSRKLSLAFFKGETPLPLLLERRRNLIEVAKKMTDWSAVELIRQAGCRVFSERHMPEGIAWHLMVLFPIAYGDDIREYTLGKRWRLCFAKRLQLFALMYHGRAASSTNNLPLLKDIDRVGPITDYHVANALRGKRVLRYSPELRQRVDNQKVIPAGTRMEIEIRAASTVAVSDLLAKINDLKRQFNMPLITMLELDHELYNLGKHKTDFYHHLTKTTAY